MLKKYILILLVVFLAIASGCTEQKEIKEIVVPGHGNQVYTFTNDIRESLKVPVNEPIWIRQIFATSNHFIIVFDGSDSQDNAYFRIVLIDLGKITIYYAYEGRILTFGHYYYIGEQWYNETGDNITKPEFNYPVLWLLGPSTGAEETSIKQKENIIYIQGTSYKNLTLAGDKLTLLVFGIDKV